MNETAVVIGASSGLGRALCEHLGALGYDLILSARNVRDLMALAADLEIKHGIRTTVLSLDVAIMNTALAKEYVDNCLSKSDLIRQVYLTAAVIRDEDQGEKSIAVLKEIFDTNFFGISFLFSQFAKRLSMFDSNITVISSITAMRARSQNIAYASSKIALEFFVSGLRHYYAGTKLKIQIYRIGYMDTAMAQGKKLPLPPVSTHRVAAHIYKYRNSEFGIRYFPRYWKYLAVVLRLVPWFIYKKLRF